MAMFGGKGPGMKAGVMRPQAMPQGLPDMAALRRRMVPQGMPQMQDRMMRQGMPGMPMAPQGMPQPIGGQPAMSRPDIAQMLAYLNSLRR